MVTIGFLLVGCIMFWLVKDQHDENKRLHARIDRVWKRLANNERSFNLMLEASTKKKAEAKKNVKR